MRAHCHVVLLFATVAVAQQPMPVGLGDSQPRPAVPPPTYADEVPIDRPNFFTEISLGGGSFEHRTKGSDLDDKTSAGYFKLQFEGFSDMGFGGGIRIEAVGSDDNLFEGTANPLSQAGSGELFLYFGYRPRLERWELPMRVGLILHNYGLEENISGDRIDYTSGGIRFEIVPDFALVQRQNLRWSLYSALSFGFGSTTVSTDPDTFEADSTTAMFGFDLGTRLRIGLLDLGVGYVYRSQTVDDSEVVGSFYYLGVEQEFSGLQVTLGVVF